MILANSLVLMIGGALLTIPIVLHFMMQPKPKVAVFPAIRFLRQQQHATKRRIQIRHWVLLALRGLVIMLLALALAGPAVAESDFSKWLGVTCFGAMALIAATLMVLSSVGTKANSMLQRILLAVMLACLAIAGWMAYGVIVTGSNASIGNTAEPVSAIIIVDNSPRMTYVKDNSANIDRAREMAYWVLSQLPPDSEVGVLDLADDEPFFSVDIAAARKRVETFPIRYLTLPIPEVLRRGLTLLKKGRFERREVYVISDLTKTTWASSIDLSEKIKEDPNLSVFVVDVGVPNPVNLSINEMKLASDKLSMQSKLVVDASFSSTFREEQRVVQLSIEKPNLRLPVVQDGVTVVPNEFWVQSETITIPAIGTVTAEFQFGQPLPIGVHHGSLTIVGGDGLALDDQRYFTFELRERWKAMIVAPDNVKPDRLTLMLMPENLVKLDAAPFDCTVVKPEAIADHDLSQFQSIYLLDPPPLPDTTWSMLQDYVARGGGLGIFLGNNARAGGSQVDPSFNSPQAHKLIGGEISNLLERYPATETKDSLWYLSPTDLSHPIFKLIRSYESSLAWYSFPVYRHWGVILDPEPEVPTQVILAFNNREPAIIERVIGDGRVLTMTTPITDLPGPKAWNQLFVGQPVPAFLLIRQLSEYLAQIQQDTLNIQAGQSAALKNDLRLQPEAYTLFTPDLKQAPTRVVSNRDQIRYKFTDVPGQYRLKGSRDAAPVLRGFSANLAPSATDMTRIPNEQLTKVFGEGNFKVAQDKIAIQRQQGSTRKGQEFYPLIIAMLCVVFGLEYVMSNRFYSKSSNGKSA